MLLYYVSEIYIWVLQFTCCTTVPWISIWRWSFQSNTSHVVPFLTTITLYHVVKAFWHFASAEHFYFLVWKPWVRWNTSTPLWVWKRSQLKHLAKCCRILSCSNSISSKLSPLAAWKAYAIAYTPQSATPCCFSDDTHPVVSFLNLLHHFVPSKVCSKLGGLAVSAQILSPTYNIDTRKYL